MEVPDQCFMFIIFFLVNFSPFQFKLLPAKEKPGLTPISSLK